MKKITDEEIIKFLKDNIEPIKGYEKNIYYRASVELTDGLFLPCVTFKNPNDRIDLAIKRFEQEKKGKGNFQGSKNDAYRSIIKNFVTSGNRINNYDISSIQQSKYAIPFKTLSLIHGETTMGWTAFVLKMKDGKNFSYGSSFLFDFFDLPEGYSFNDVTDVINHSFVMTDGKVLPFNESRKITQEERDKLKIFRERPYFDCYIDGI